MKKTHQLLAAAFCISSTFLAGACAGTQHAAELAVVEREAWGWQDNAATLPEHRIEKITIHHGGETFSDDRDPRQYLRALQSWSRTDKGWIDIPYRYRELSAAQLTAVIQLSAMLARQYKVPVSDIRGHLDYAPGETDCPGKNIYRYLRDGTISDEVAELLLIE